MHQRWNFFVYNHVALLSWLRKRDGWIEILWPGATRFATTFIALKSLHDHKHELQALVTSKFFVDSRYSKDNKSKVAVSIILDNRFWNDCLIVVNLMSPLMCLLRIVDCDERPSMGYVYEGMYRVRLGIKKLFNYNERLYKPYTMIINMTYKLWWLVSSLWTLDIQRLIKTKLQFPSSWIIDFEMIVWLLWILCLH